MIAQVGDQVDHDVDDGHPHHVGLNDRVVAHVDRIHRQLADAVPHEDGLDDGRAAEQ